MSINLKIFNAARFGDFDSFLKLFDKNNINLLNDDGYSLLHLSISGKQLQIIDYLLNNGINVNLQDRQGSTALHYLCERHNISLCKKVLSLGADVNIRDNYGNNALWTAVVNCKQQYYDIVELLMKYSPDVDTKNKYGRSPSDFAAQIDDVKLQDLLNCKNKPQAFSSYIDNKGGCIITKSLLNNETSLKWLFRENAVNDADSGWRAFGALDTQEYINNTDNHIVVSVNTLIEIEPAVLSVINYPVGTELEFNNKGGKKYFSDRFTGEIIY